MNDAEKAQAMRTWLARLAEAQPTRNQPWVWAMDGMDLPPVALAQLYDLVKGGC